MVLKLFSKLYDLCPLLGEWLEEEGEGSSLGGLGGSIAPGVFLGHLKCLCLWDP